MDRCNPHMDRQFRNPHVDHFDPHVDQESDLCVDHISKFSVESDLYMSHVWIFVSHVWLFVSHVWLFVSHVWLIVIHTWLAASHTWLIVSHTWLTKIHTWLTMSHTWLFVSHVWITKIIWENCQLREIYRNILLVKASWWLWIIISHNSKPLKADVDLKWRSYRYQLKWSPEKWLGQESQRNWKC